MNFHVWCINLESGKCCLGLQIILLFNFPRLCSVRLDQFGCQLVLCGWVDDEQCEE